MSETRLEDRHCKAISGEAHRISAERIATELGDLPGWALADDGKSIRKTFRFDDYYRTIAFVNALAFVANRENHHPDLGVHYDRCVVTFSTHDANGVTENDLICAAKAERLGSDR